MENGLQNFILAIMPLPEISLTDKCTRLENHALAAQKGKNVPMNIQGYVLHPVELEKVQSLKAKSNFEKRLKVQQKEQQDEQREEGQQEELLQQLQRKKQPQPLDQQLK